LAVRTLAHLSDLHLGIRGREVAARRACERLLELGVDRVVVTGDITHSGKAAELQLFRSIFAPLLESGRLAAVPGNHDRMNDDVRNALMPGGRVCLERHPDLVVVKVDSTSPANRSAITSQGALDEADCRAIENAVSARYEGRLVILALHHHLMPLPAQDLGERFATWMGTRWAAEVDGGRGLLERLRGRIDLVLHGHRHLPGEQIPYEHLPRPVRIHNAGATTLQGRFCVFTHAAGRILASRWERLLPGLGAEPATRAA
jgi:3',5'-cyclic-AMP phosphodiesterase